MRILAVIPARGGSKRLPGKNTKLLFDKPLIAWTIDFAQSMPCFTDIQVSTDSAQIAAVCSAQGMEVARLRPVELATDDATSVDVVLDILDWKRSLCEEFDAVALLQPTSPVRFGRRWEEACELLGGAGCEAVIGVSEALTHPLLTFKSAADGCLAPWVPNPAGISRSQDFPPAYAVNGALYLIKVDTLIKQRTFFPASCRAVVCAEKVENIDIDTPFDWRVAEMTIAHWKANQ